MCGAYVSAHVASLDGKGENIQTNIISGSTISSSISLRCCTVYSPLLQHHFLSVKVTAIVLLQRQLSGTSSYSACELLQLPVGGSASRTPAGFPQRGWESSKKLRFTTRFLEKRWEMMINHDKPTARDKN